uniref:Cubilin n=1 Tax=Scolopendra viridis TaxID=118503 RepID=A0A4D5R953_SCOVI
MICSQMSIQLSVYLSVLIFPITSVTSDSPLIENIPDCNLTITSEQGEINSPDYPYPAPANTSCFWKFSINGSDQWLYIRFDKFMLHEDDVLTITYENLQNQTFSGLRAPFIVLTFRSATVKLVTGNTIFDRSFHAKYSSQDCSMNMAENYGLFSSPIYPPNFTKPYPPAQCKWILTAQAKQKIALSFITFNLQKKSKIQIFNSPDAKPPIAANLTGNILPADQISKEMHMTVLFTWDVIEQDVSFQSEFNSAYENCTGVINVTDKYSIGPPINRPFSDLFCVWILQTNASEGNASFLMNFFEKLNLHNLFDSLVISDGPSRYSPILQVYADGMTAVHDRITSKNSVYVSFTSKASFNSSTFILDFDVQVNGGNYNGSGNFSLNPSKLKENKTVIFNLEVPEKKQVEATILSTIPEGSQVNFYGILPNNERLPLTFFTSTNTTYPIFTTSNKMIIEAVNFTEKESLYGYFHGIPRGCDQFDNLEIGAYQLNDDIESNCIWFIKPSNISKKDIVSLTFNTLNLGERGTVKVYQGLAGKSDNLIQSFNSSIEYFPTIVISPDVGVRVDTYLDKSKNTNSSITRMSAFYEVVPGCSVIDDLKSGSVKELKSPGYPTRYSLNANCKWSLNVPQNLTVLLHFDDVDLYPSDAISIYVVHNGSSKLFYNISEKGMPSDSLISNENITVVWNSSVANASSHSVRGFSLKTEVLDCGENITKTSGEFVIPGEAALKLNQSLKCVWIIDVGEQSKSGDVFIVKFNYQQTSGGNNSSYSFEILDGGSLSSNILNIHNSTSSSLSRTNKIFIKYSADKSTVHMPSFKFSYSAKACDKSHQCKNGICMHDDWKCNGENNCGDYSDEDNCNEPVTQAGVSTTIVVVLALLAFLSGIGVALIAPFAIRKVRAFRQRYNDFHTLPDD